jgi:hypothetical protein
VDRWREESFLHRTIDPGQESRAEGILGILGILD